MTIKHNVLISGPDPVDEPRYQEALRVTGLLEDLDGAISRSLSRLVRSLAVFDCL